MVTWYPLLYATSSMPAILEEQNVLAISGTITPITLLRFSFKDSAIGLGLYFSLEASSWTISRVSFFISDPPRSARDTVETDSFNDLAISLIVTLCCALMP